MRRGGRFRNASCEKPVVRSPRLTHEAWLDVWHGHHTRVAIDTQDNFLYVQNVVVRALTHAAPGYDAI
ncbi:EthD domain-containing protein, partial [Burkholderia cenocepacia]